MTDLSRFNITENGKKYIAIQGKVDEGCHTCAFAVKDGDYFSTCSRQTVLCSLPNYAYYALDYQDPKDIQTDMILPTDSAVRKQIPITSGVLDYFPLAIAEVAKASWAGNQQHHPDKPLHWDKTKSTDHADCIARHLVDRGKFDTDGQRHSAKLAWRALALLQLELENEKGNE